MSDTTNQVEEPNQSLNQAAAATKPAIAPLLMISGILSLLAGVFSFQSFSWVPDVIDWAQSPDNVAPFITWMYLLVFALTPLLAFGAAYLAIIKRDLKRHAIVATAAYVVPAIVAIILDAIYISITYGIESVDFVSLLRNFAPVDESSLVEIIGLILLIINIVVAWIAFVVSKNTTSRRYIISNNNFGGAPNMSNQQPIGYDPQTGAPIYQPGYMRPESQLPLIALIGAILFPLVGIIVGHIALGQMKRGEIPSSNMGLAKIGLILGYAFMGLGILAATVYIVLFVAIVGPGLDF
jgi:hypothetical protein